MTTALTGQILAALSEFLDSTRLIALTVGGASADLLVEAFSADDALQEVGNCDVIALSTSAFIAVESLLGQPATLEISLADGTRSRFSGEISEAALLGSDGGLARYRIRIAPWIWRLDHVRNCRVWQDKSVIEIVDAVFEAYLPLARWRWSEETNSFMAGARPRSYCCQYRESDLDFVQRLLAEEGLCWRVEHDDGGHGLVLFADSSQRSAVPEDASSAAGGGVRYHGASSVEEYDSVQGLVAQQRLHATLTTLLSADYKGRRTLSADSPSHVRYQALPELETYDVPGQYAFADSAQARRHAELQMQGHEARGQLWQGRSTVRTLRAGTRLDVSGAPLRKLGASSSFTILRVRAIGINNMPPLASHALAELFGPIPELLAERTHARSDDIELVIEQARRTGYANCFEAVPTELPWRPRLDGSDGRTRTKPTARGTQSAIVIGAGGSDSPHGADELYCDQLGRVRIRFHWQEQGDASCWVRVAQRLAGSGMGFQFVPRIGQEVLVQFLENDIDRPLIVGALYNGQGEGGIVPTPGGQINGQANTSVFERAHDHAASGQGNLAGGNSPVWHGASPDGEGHRNGAAQWGIRSKEFGGNGYSQLLFDDTDAQGRVQLRCTYAGSELNLGNIIHAQNNYRGNFRGQGLELRTDAAGGVSASRGILITSELGHQNVIRRSLVCEVAPAKAALDSALKIVEVLHQSTIEHQTVGIASYVGTNNENESGSFSGCAPIHAFRKILSTSSADNAGIENIQEINEMKELGQDAKSKQSIIILESNNQIGVEARQAIQLTSGEAIAIVNGQGQKFAIGGYSQVHAGQAIGVLSRALSGGSNEGRLNIISAKDEIDIQAQGDLLKIVARDEVAVTSSKNFVNFASAKSIRLAVSGGAKILIENGNIYVTCPGRLAVNAGKKSLVGPAKVIYSLPLLPTAICPEFLLKARRSGSPFILRDA